MAVGRNIHGFKVPITTILPVTKNAICKSNSFAKTALLGMVCLDLQSLKKNQRQLFINGAHVAGKPVQNAPTWVRMEEPHRGQDDFAKHVVVQS